MNTTTTTRKPATKPASVKPATKPTSKPASASSVAVKPDVSAQATKPASAVFSLVAGTIAQVTNKGIRGAIAYHVGLGNLERVDAGIKLTEQGAQMYAKRFAAKPMEAQQIASFVHGGALPACITRWNAPNAKPMEVAGTLQGGKLQFPNIIFWESFNYPEMRLAFAALWARTAK